MSITGEFRRAPSRLLTCRAPASAMHGRASVQRGVIGCLLYCLWTGPAEARSGCPDRHSHCGCPPLRSSTARTSRYCLVRLSTSMRATSVPFDLWWITRCDPSRVLFWRLADPVGKAWSERELVPRLERFAL